MIPILEYIKKTKTSNYDNFYGVRVYEYKGLHLGVEVSTPHSHFVIARRDEGLYQFRELNRVARSIHSEVPTIDDWQDIAKNLTEINGCIDELGGDRIDRVDANYWSCTPASPRYVKGMIMFEGKLIETNLPKDEYCCLYRAIVRLPINK